MVDLNSEKIENLVIFAGHDCRHISVPVDGVSNAGVNAAAGDGEGNLTEFGVAPTPGCEVDMDPQKALEGIDTMLEFAIARLITQQTADNPTE